MQSVRIVLDRAVSALVLALGVVLLTAGVFAYASSSRGPGQATFEPGDPIGPSPTAVGAASPSPGPTPTRGPLASPTPTPLPSATPSAEPLPPEVATRIAIPALAIDLPVVAGDLEVPGNVGSYPLCDVAQYLVGFAQPGQPGTTYVYAHARAGMFLPLLEASQRADGRRMIGGLVEVYTSADRLHIYEIYLVKRHATDLSLAYQLPDEGAQLILQTSEGPRGTIPKLQVAARPLSVVAADMRDALPEPRPRACP